MYLGPIPVGRVVLSRDRPGPMGMGVCVITSSGGNAAVAGCSGKNPLLEVKEHV